MADVDALIGHTVAGFQVDEFLGEEALGKLYRAKRGTKKVILKVLHPHLAQNFEAFGRFQRETMASALLESNPNVVKMLDFGDHRGIFHYLVMEDVEATPLSDHVASKALPTERVAAIAWQVAGALDAAHQASIVHRNLVPENILLLDAAQGDFVKVRDFGMARLSGEEGAAGQQLTSAGARVGTVEYMAPEYVEAEELTPAADMYGLGCLMFTMLVGHPPFQGKKHEVLEAHIATPPPAPSSKAKGVPKWMDQIVLGLLAKEPVDRPSAVDVMAAIEKGVGHPIELPPITGGAKKPKPTPAAVEAPAGGSILPKVMVAIGLLVLVGGIVALLVTVLGVFLATS